MRDKKQTSRLFQLALSDAIQSRLSTVSKIRAEMDIEKKRRRSKCVSSDAQENILSPEMIEFMKELQKVEKMPYEEKKSGYQGRRKNNRYEGLPSNKPLNNYDDQEIFSRRRLDLNSMGLLNDSKPADYANAHDHKTDSSWSMKNEMGLNETSANCIFTSSAKLSCGVNMFPQRNGKSVHEIPLPCDSDDSFSYDLPIFSKYEMSSSYETNVITSSISNEEIPPPSYGSPSEFKVYQQPLKGLDLKTKSFDINYIPGPSFDFYEDINKLKGLDSTNSSNVQNTAYLEGASYDRCYSNSSELKCATSDLCEKYASVANNANNLKSKDNFHDFCYSNMELEPPGKVANIAINCPNLTEDNKIFLNGLFPNSSDHGREKPTGISPLDSFSFESVYKSLDSSATESYSIEPNYAIKNEGCSLLQFDEVINKSKSTERSRAFLDKNEDFLSKCKTFNSMEKTLRISDNNESSSFRYTDTPQHVLRSCDNTLVTEHLSSLTLNDNKLEVSLEETINKSFMKNNKPYRQISFANDSLSPVRHSSDVSKSLNLHEMDHSDLSDGRGLKNIKSEKTKNSFKWEVSSLDSSFEFSPFGNHCSVNDSLATASDSRLNYSEGTPKVGLNATSPKVNLVSKNDIDAELSMKTFLFQGKMSKLSKSSDLSETNDQFHQHESSRIFNLIDDLIEKL